MLSIVTSVFRTSQFLDEFTRRIVAASVSCGFDHYELIFVVDGSPDNALPVLRELKARHANIRIVDLSRNFGHHPALWCGLEQARGELVFLIDSDLETPPEVLSQFKAALETSDVVFGFSANRTRATSRLFWWIFGMVGHVDIHPNLLTERLMTRRYVDSLLRMGDRGLFLGAMMQWIGFRQVPVPVARTRRPGPSSYSWTRRAALAFDAVTTFSTAPLILVFAAGTAIAALSLIAAAVLISMKLANPAFIVHGFTAIAVLILFSLGSILAALGLIGLYLGKVFLQTKQRPIYIIREEL